MNLRFATVHDAWKQVQISNINPHMDVSENRVPQNGWFIMENLKTLLKWMIWVYPYFRKH